MHPSDRILALVSYSACDADMQRRSIAAWRSRFDDG
jgi:hypothetical protein